MAVVPKRGVGRAFRSGQDNSFRWLAPRQYRSHQHSGTRVSVLLIYGTSSSAMAFLGLLALRVCLSSFSHSKDFKTLSLGAAEKEGLSLGNGRRVENVTPGSKA
uniref:Uncharacterized protein n=1 Tax=Anopheles atroparvus TaxID=41427 RepID=A0A182IJH4_ANOAO